MLGGVVIRVCVCVPLGRGVDILGERERDGHRSREAGKAKQGKSVRQSVCASTLQMHSLSQLPGSLLHPDPSCHGLLSRREPSASGEIT